MSVFAMIKRSFPVINKRLFLVLYSVYVRPHLEYCVQVWAPYFQKDMKILEKLQQRTTKLVKAIKKWPYEERLACFGLYSLDRRRWREDLIESFKILNGFKCIDPEKFFSRVKSTQLRGHRDKLFKDRSKLLCCSNFFSQRVVSYWNRLPQQVVETVSIDVFKRRLDKHMDRCRDEQ